ncbi:MAG: cyclic nucleotide-binding domain-containing protein [Candidatus Riflebacteria bacterium]|nr:cyclic nucleotide-binding domain-containing protein [Candidatus Riflebacteria bacterium]
MSLNEKLRENSLFSDFSNAELELLSTFTEEVNYAEGAAIISEQAPTTAVYFILNGRVTIYKALVGASNFITILEKNDIFGEIAFVDQQYRSASVNALDECSLAKFEYSHFDIIQKQSPIVGLKLLKALIKEITSKFRAVSSCTDLKSPDHMINDLIISRQKVKISTDTTDYICAIMYADKSGVNPLLKIDFNGQTILLPFNQVRTISLPNKFGKFQ